MARKAKTKKATSARRSAQRHSAQKGQARPNDPAVALRAALLRRIATQGWRDLSLAEIAEEAGIDMASAHAIYATKVSILLGLARAGDEMILESLKADPLDGSPKDRIFDLLMRRFDLLQQDRDAYLTLLRELTQTPFEAAYLTKQMRRSLSLMLEIAGISASGFKGFVRLQGLVGIYLAGLHAWRRDDSQDLSKTMAEIDKRLNQAVKISEIFSQRHKAA